MNLSELRKLKSGENIIFKHPFPKFTEGEEYEVKTTKVGRIVVDDNGMGQFLSDIYEHFELNHKDE